MKMIAGSASTALSKAIAGHCNLEICQSKVEYFADQELRVQLLDDLYNEKVIICQSIAKPANDRLMELLLLSDAAYRSGAKYITALIPYFGYSRQDRPAYNYGPISASLVARLLEASYVDQVIMLDIHSRQIEGMFKIRARNLSAESLFTSHLKSQLGPNPANAVPENTVPDTVIVSPDIGGVARARSLSEAVNLDLVIINKSRDSERNCTMHDLIGNVQYRHCIIVDDIVDTAGTLSKAAELLLKQGAKSVSAYISHAILSHPALELLSPTLFKKIITTDSMAHSNLPDHFEVLSCSELFASALRPML
ncbi:MAG: ribose-phosphate diphosphokinase [Gammaproteobacteria bacterium]